MRDQIRRLLSHETSMGTLTRYTSFANGSEAMTMIDDVQASTHTISFDAHRQTDSRQQYIYSRVPSISSRTKHHSKDISAERKKNTFETREQRRPQQNKQPFFIYFSSACIVTFSIWNFLGIFNFSDGLLWTLCAFNYIIIIFISTNHGNVYNYREEKNYLINYEIVFADGAHGRYIVIYNI